MVSKKRGQITPGIGNRLRQIRERNGMTRDSVAESVGISVRHLAAVELEQKSASVDTLYHLFVLWVCPPIPCSIRNWMKRTAIWNSSIVSRGCVRLKNGIF